MHAYMYVVICRYDSVHVHSNVLVRFTKLFCVLEMYVCIFNTIYVYMCMYTVYVFVYICMYMYMYVCVYNM